MIKQLLSKSVNVDVSKDKNMFEVSIGLQIGY